MNNVMPQPANWLRKTLAIAGVTLMTSLTVTAAQASFSNGSPDPIESAGTNSSLSQLFDLEYCSDDLAKAIDAIITRPEFATASWGISIQSLVEDTEFYAYNAERLLIPASNIKLITTAAAMRIIADRDPQALLAFRDELNVINRNSNNARADALLRGIGGQTQVRAALAPLGIHADSFIQADGSGLSRENKAKASTFVTLLKGMYETDDSGLFYDSLPIGGVNGTLRNRFENTAMLGKVHAKTGTLRGVRALSGYLEADEYGTLVFSIVINQPGQSGGVMLAAIDEIVAEMSQLEACY